MASLFNLAILEENKYKENNFKTNKVLSGKKPKQFTKTADVLEYLQTLGELYQHSLYIRNHILQYCRLPRYNKFTDEYKKIIIMVSLADHKFDDRYNLKNNFKHFHMFFKAIHESRNSPDNIKTDMTEVSNKITDYIRILKSISLTSEQCTNFQTNIKPLQADLFKNVENIVNDYNRTSKELLECDHLNDFLTSINANHPCSSTTLKHSILYYGFIINHNNIIKLHLIVSQIIEYITALDIIKEKRSG